MTEEPDDATRTAPASPLRSARAAFVFLTRVPVGGFPYTEAEWRGAAGHFPLVGAAVGAATAAVFELLRPAGAFAAALLGLGASLLMTGAFHEDGLADTADALGGAFDRDKILAILKDSRVGTYGACAVVLSLAGRAALVAQLGDRAAWALPLVGAAARVGPVWQIATQRYVTPEHSRSRSVVGAGRAQAWTATAWAIAVGLALAAARLVPPLRAAAAAAACAGVTAFCSWRYQRRLGGITGDFLGATEQLCELAALVALAWGS